MLFNRLAIGLGSLLIAHPILKIFGFIWEPATVDIEAITDTVEQEDDMSNTNVYQNGVLFGVWVAGVAISVARLLSYAISGVTGKNGIDESTQTELQAANEDEPCRNLAPEEEDINDKIVINQESNTTFTAAAHHEVQGEPLIELEDLGSPPNDEETTQTNMIEEIPREGKGEGSKVVPDPETDEKEDKPTKSETKISVYKLPAIKRHSFMILQDGMKALRQSVQGKFSLEKVALDGVRNFIFIVAKGTPDQLSDLETKVKADFRWLTPVRDPSSKLTGVPATKERKWVSSTSPKESSHIPTRVTISPRARSPGLRAGIPLSTPNPNKSQK